MGQSGRDEVEGGDGTRRAGTRLPFDDNLLVARGSKFAVPEARLQKKQIYMSEMVRWLEKRPLGSAPDRSNRP